MALFTEFWHMLTTIQCRTAKLHHSYSSFLFMMIRDSACNDMVNYSIDENCEGLITVDMIMEGDFVDEFYVITLVNAGGQPVPNPIGQQYIGEILTATVLDICTGNSCTGNIRIEDKLPPIVKCDQPMCNLLDLSGEWDASDNAFSPGACWAFDGFTPNPNVLYDVPAIYCCCCRRLHLYHG